ncbi:hypothetical protein EGR_05458 [Echinococcus granulosus]|uniref:Uncharacterized protein n=1 Tax=Echinococcus granulosus TaxID=6210 RepID=W6UFM6_ECHGR|nr:hypothetical protein EGR_05458 [Echinococcus granulosus]EUB59696.1 hypothetical protein EGR_05458 [Echinococcus granulosus]
MEQFLDPCHNTGGEDAVPTYRGVERLPPLSPFERHTLRAPYGHPPASAITK